MNIGSMGPEEEGAALCRTTHWILVERAYQNQDVALQAMPYAGLKVLAMCKV